MLTISHIYGHGFNRPRLSQLDNVRKVSFMSVPAVHVETNMQSWDLIITI